MMQNKDNINTVAHRWLKEVIQPDWIAVDATAGNGNDTLFLLQHCQRVYAFDIQPLAQENTLKRCSGYSNLIFFLASHERIEEFVKERIHCAVFNFGYLPHCDSSCITRPESSVKAIDAAARKLEAKGVLSLACYLGHEGGKEEHEAIFKWIQRQKNFTLKSYTQKEGAPILYFLTKTE